MYPQIIHENLGSLAEYLLSKPEPHEIDEDGCLSTAACKAIDVMLINELSARLKGFQMPADPAKGSDPNNRWRTVSSLQKAIRFGDAEAAKFAASAASDMDSQYLYRRLGVTAVEDIGVANLFTTLACLAVLGNKAFRKAADERRLACYLAEQLAIGAKDRSMVDLIVMVDTDPELPKEEMSKFSTEVLTSFIDAEAHQVQLRMCAAWALAGTKRWTGDTMPADNDRPMSLLQRHMVERGVCRAMLYGSKQTASRLSETMWVSWLLVDEWLKTSKRFIVQQMPLPPVVKVGKLLGAAYDQHTREGKTAIFKFFKDCAAMQPYIQACPPDKRTFLMMNSVFRAEGGRMNKQLFYGPSKEVYEAVALGRNRYRHILPPELAESMLTVVEANLGLLNECREKVLWAAAKAKMNCN